MAGESTNEPSNRRELLLIDANSLIHRAFHALPPLAAPDGRPTGALYGISSVLLKLRREGMPAYAAALFDRPEPTFRKKQFDAYKAQRPPTPEPLVDQIIEAHNLFTAFGIRVFEKAGFEADDLIATLATTFGGKDGVSATILTGDLDTLQLVADGAIAVRVFKTGLSETTTYDEAAVRARYGLRPDQLADYKTFVGDASDNIPGIAGIGPKTAQGLLQKFGTMGNIYRRVDEIPQKAKLLAERENVGLMKTLVTAVRDVPLEVASFENLAVREDDGKLRGYLANLGFTTLLKRIDNAPAGILPTPQKKPKTDKAKTRNPAQGTMF